MFKDYLKENQISIYQLSKDCGIPYSTLNDLANGKVDIDNCKVGLLLKISEYLGMPIEDTLSLIRGKHKERRNAYGTDYLVQVRNKSYYLVMEYMGEPVEIELCKVNGNSAYYIEEIARWRSESYIREMRMKEFR